MDMLLSYCVEKNVRFIVQANFVVQQSMILKIDVKIMFFIKHDSISSAYQSESSCPGPQWSPSEAFSSAAPLPTAAYSPPSSDLSTRLFHGPQIPRPQASKRTPIGLVHNEESV